MMDFVIAAIEGFQFGDGFVIRELTLIFPDNSEQHFQFKNPDVLHLDEADRRTAKFTKNHLNGFSATDDGTCLLPHKAYTGILREIENCRIYVAGEQTKHFFSLNLPYTPVTDIYSLLDFQYPNELNNPGCGLLHRFRYCTLAKARYLRDKLTGFKL